MVPAAGGKSAYPSCAGVQGPDGGVEVDFVPEGVREGGPLGHRRGDGRLEEFHGTWGGRAVVRYRVPWGCTALGRPVRVVVAGCFWFKKEAIADEGNLLSRRLLGALRPRGRARTTGANSLPNQRPNQGSTRRAHFNLPVLSFPHALSPKNYFIAALLQTLLVTQPIFKNYSCPPHNSWHRWTTPMVGAARSMNACSERRVVAAPSR
jgi:hypothetical protein